MPAPRYEVTAASRAPYRDLRVFTLDPSTRMNLPTRSLAIVTLRVPREIDSRTGRDVLQPGPVGRYVEVVDVDPASKCCYAPVDLNDMELLLQAGLAPSEANPQFHQQMVYAVAMTTIRSFERALGRCVLWSPHRYESSDEHRRGSSKKKREYVGRLRIYPHAFRGANAFYSPKKKALLFGYFQASQSNPGSNLPGGTVFACLSHDIIAHETTHAILDGIHPRFTESTNPDVLAFHEAFADVVALFQHFSFPDALRQQIGQTSGDLTRQNLLGQLAQQFGEAIGRYGALRDAIGGRDDATQQWKLKEPNPLDFSRTFEPHERGAILVSAVFEAFLDVYKMRIADLLRIATGGTGVLPQGQLHPDLIDRMAQEAASTASHIQQMCIRAVDYCPPVDITFGEFLRALITADENLVPDDTYGYRIAMIDAFRRRGIFPLDARTLAPDSLRWDEPTHQEQTLLARFIGGAVLDLVGRGFLESTDWDLTSDRQRVYDQMRDYQLHLHQWFQKPQDPRIGGMMGLALGKGAPKTIGRSHGQPLVEVHSIRPARRTGPDGQQMTELVIEITQRRRAFLDAQVQERADRGGASPAEPDFWFRGGCTLLVDPQTGFVRYSIKKDITSKTRLQRQRDFLNQPDGSLRATYFGNSRLQAPAEPFACVHRGFFEGDCQWAR